MSDEITPERIPVVEETVAIGKRRTVKGVVRARTETHEDAVTIDEPTLIEEVDVERVPIGRFVDAALPPRQEGDTTIIPVFEEVVVVEKRLKLVEEVRLTKRRTSTREPQSVTLRRQEAVVERLPGPGHDPDPDRP